MRIAVIAEAFMSARSSPVSPSKSETVALVRVEAARPGCPGNTQTVFSE